MALGKYTPLLRKRGAHEPSFCYLMDTLLQSRIAMKCESNRDFYDEDVNVYLALLLNSIVTDRFHRAAAEYLAARECDLCEILDRADNVYTKHEIYRLNADHLLLQTGLFTVPHGGDLVPSGLATAVERGRAYYRFAYSFADRLPVRYRPVSDVVHKLAYDFEKYRRVLSHMRGAYLNLLEPLSTHDVTEFRKDMEERTRAERVRTLQDLLLDTYLEYRRAPSESTRTTLGRRFEDLKRLEPGAWPGFALPGPIDGKKQAQ